MFNQEKLSNQEIRKRIKEIKESTTLSDSMKRIALNCLKEQWLAQQADSTGFSSLDDESVTSYRKKLIYKAVKQGLPQMLAEQYSSQQLHDYLDYKVGIRTALDESELA